MACAHCVLDTKGYKHMLIICNTSCLSIVAVERQKVLLITWLHKHTSMLHYMYNACLVQGRFEDLNNMMKTQIGKSCIQNTVTVRQK
jgi:hypothetical protein